MQRLWRLLLTGRNAEAISGPFEHAPDSSCFRRLACATLRPPYANFLAGSGNVFALSLKYLDLTKLDHNLLGS